MVIALNEKSINSSDKPCCCPCSCTKSKVRTTSKLLMSMTLYSPFATSLVTALIEIKPNASAYARYVFMLSVLPRCMHIFKSGRVIDLSFNLLTITSRLPDPCSLNTIGIDLSSSSVISSSFDRSFDVWAIATISSFIKGVYFSWLFRDVPSTSPRSISFAAR